MTKDFEALKRRVEAAGGYIEMDEYGALPDLCIIRLDKDFRITLSFPDDADRRVEHYKLLNLALDGRDADARARRVTGWISMLIAKWGKRTLIYNELEEIYSRVCREFGIEEAK